MALQTGVPIYLIVVVPQMPSVLITVLLFLKTLVFAFPLTSFIGFYPQNCVTAMSNKIKSQIGILAGVALLVCLVEIIGMVLAFFLSRAISEEYEKV